jgi:hypothetical protein
MMETAIPIMTSVEQMGARSAPADLSANQKKPEETSFAKNFTERIADATPMQADQTLGESMVDVRDLKTAQAMKTTSEIADVPVGVKGKAVAAPATSLHDEPKNLIVGRLTPLRIAIVTGLRKEATAGDSGTSEVEAVTQVGNVAGGKPVAPGVSQAMPLAKVEGEVVATSAEAAQDQLLASSGSSTEVQSSSVGQVKTAAPEKRKEIAGEKKLAKRSESEATSAAGQKNIDGSTTSVLPKGEPLVGGATDGLNVLQIEMAAVNVVPQNATGSVTGVLEGGIAEVAKLSKATFDGSVRKEPGFEVKADVTEIVTAGTAGEEQVALPKHEVAIERVSAGASSMGDETEVGTQAGSGLPASIGHALVGGIGIVPSGASEAVGSGNDPRILIATNVPAAGGVSHTADNQAGLRGHDAYGTAMMPGDELPRMLTASPTSLEVGIQNGTHGWLKVRADMADGGAVNASVSAASPAGQEMLHRELPTLTAYLQSEKVAVNTVVIHAAPGNGTDAQSSRGMDGTGGQTSQRSNDREEQHNFRKTVSDETAHRSLHAVDEDGTLPLAAYAIGGTWLSVRA